MELWNKYQGAVKKLLLIIVIFAIIYVSITYLFPFFAPFIIAIIVSYINEPVIRLLQKFKISRKVAAIISLLITMSLLVSVITLGIIKIYDELIILRNNLEIYSNDISAQINSLTNKITSLYNALPAEATDAITKNLASLSNKLTSIITAIIQYTINTASSIPKLAVFFIVTILSTYFISSDKKKITLFFYRQLPLSWRKEMPNIKRDTINALFGYFKAILILMGFTFIEVSVGLFVLNVKYAFVIALIVGISEAIPIIGTGTVMIPWILWNIIAGNMPLAFGLAILYILGVLIRQIMEPKIVGSQIGLHPLVTLLAMYVGLEFFGVLGMFIGPISLIIVKSLQDSGILSLWND
ncbi:sporulation integral membrane protein YtvI [Ruminiclostridium sufflavum DSM 19573]|uniref:Sporulation integral membrane protein YtvI n=1 Tax=Ruminiclostridium sufflavum DSM 19573 TaxID=1121337 RepID=A0A318Y5C8_9FIRM|nr:sporulation integral membrane protein YtvI [Ruminiclostridium sufflavum]PYG87191.1 sporulation integral membrane protein YtvI [Ruminiclostridium sufflavum DSM 19573]